MLPVSRFRLAHFEQLYLIYVGDKRDTSYRGMYPDPRVDKFAFLVSENATNSYDPGSQPVHFDGIRLHHNWRSLSWLCHGDCAITLNHNLT